MCRPSRTAPVRLSRPPNQDPVMEAERVNTLRNQLTDLSARVVDLRRYL